jgi:K+ transporter
MNGFEGAFVLGTHKPIVTVESTTSPDSSNAPKSDHKSSTSADSMAIIPEKTNSQESIRRRTIQELFLRATDTPVARLPGISIYYTHAATSHAHAPHTFRHFLEHFPALHSTCIFLQVRTAAQPHVPPSEKMALEPSPLWDGVWRGVYRVGYMETPDFSSAEFALTLFEKLGREVEGLTHVLQYTELKARREHEGRQEWWIKKVPEYVRAWAIDVLWNGVDELVGGVGKGWKVPVGEVVSVGAVAEV